MRYFAPLLVLLAVLFGTHSACGQGPAPRVYLKFDANLVETSPSGALSAASPVTASWAIVAGDYGPDRYGNATGSLNFSGSRSLRLNPNTALANNSNQTLGLRNAAGTDTSFTLSAWVYQTTANNGYNTVFGNLLTGAGTLHAGLGSGNSKVHFGFDNSNDANGATTDLASASAGTNTINVWYHLAFVYDAATQTQRVFINGIPEVTRTGAVNTLKASDLLIGNWNTTTDASNDFRGRLDDIAVYNVALSGDLIYALASGVAANALSTAGTYSAPKLPGNLGTTGKWGMREYRNFSSPNVTNSINGIATGVLVNAERIARSNPTAAASQANVVEYQAAGLNIRDPSSGASHDFTVNESDWSGGTNNGVDDNYLVMVAKCAVRIATESDYTFCFRGDDGSRLRVLGAQFTSTTKIAAGANPAVPAHSGDAVHWLTGTGDSQTLGVTHLVPGDYNVEVLHWEGSGGSSIEVSAAFGAKTAFDGTFQLVGNTAAGGLELVRDPDTYPRAIGLTANGGSLVFVQNGAPPTITLVWQTNIDVSPNTTATILPTVGSLATANGTTTIASPASTTTYTLSVTNGTETATKTVRVFVNQAPIINSFTANDTTVAPNAAVTLNWSVDGATTLTLDPGNINVTGQTSRVVNSAATTTYTLSATNAAGTVQQQVTVNVGPPPTISSFTTSDANPLYGAESLLLWNASNADTLSIDQGVGAIVGTTGSVSVVPLVTTTYTFTATNIYGSSTATVTINQPTPMGVNANGFTVTRYNASTPFPFANMGYLQSADALIAGTNLSGAPTTATGVTSINYSDGADGEFTSGNSAFPGGTGSGVNFAIKVTGTLNVNTPGDYSFVLNSDDGGRIRVDGQDVVVDDGTHSPASNSGKVTINKASVPIEIVYYNAPTNGGSAGAEVELGWIRPNLAWSLVGPVAASSPIVLGRVLISEFVADNNNTLADEDGASPDWIEIWNSTNATVNLSGYYLTDTAATPNKWAFPTGPDWTLGPNKYLVVFASEKNRRPAQAVLGQDNPGTLAQPRLHANFKLPKGGGYLALMKDDGAGGFTAVTTFATYPAQKEDVSYGSSDAESYIGYMEIPTPGQPNTVTFAGFVQDTVFDHPRGRYTAPFSLAITTATAGATIRFTTDGSTPTVTNGAVYAGPIAVNGTTVVRAAAFKAGWKPTNADTETFLFVNDIVNQTSATAAALGFPAGPVNGQVFRYGLTLGNVTAGGGTLQNLKDALAAVPTVCMTTDVSNLVNASTGIYVNAGKHGLFWERPASIEYLNAAGTSEFQIDAGVRVRGGYSRSTGNPKHAFHLFFRGALYDGSLKYRLFGDTGAAQFDQLDMRTSENYSWSFGGSAENTFLREEFSRVTQAAQGQPNARLGYFHLYINGIYWGLYDWEERTEASYGETYLGGTKEDQDVIKSSGASGNPTYSTEVTDGNFAAWKSLFDQSLALRNDTTSETSRTARYMQMRGLNPDGSRNLTYPVLLDVDNLVDYMLLTFYCGAYDAPLSTFVKNGSNNWFGVRDRAGTRGFAYFAHDFEHGMNTTSAGQTAQDSYNRVGPWGEVGAATNNWNQTLSAAGYQTRNTFNRSNPHYLHELLCFSAEYRQRFADRVQKNLFNGGALTTSAVTTRFNALATQVDSVIHAEAARWGSGSLNRNSWLTAKASALTFVNSGGSVPTGHPAMTAGDRTNLVVQFLRSYQDPISVAKPLYPITTTTTGAGGVYAPPAFAAPAFSGNFGGPVANPYNFSISNPNGTGAIYYSVNGVDPRPIGGGAPVAGVFTGTSPILVSLTSTSTVRARIFDVTLPTPWSALTQTEYLVGALAGSANLVVSKLNYHPLDSTDPNGLTEFVELMNVSASAIDLTNCRFTIGIQFQFPDGFTIAPGARALVVKDMAGFTTAYPNVPVAQIAGVYAGSLDNGGEQLQLLDANGVAIRDFTYDDAFPWPTTPDGGGVALVLRRPETKPDHGIGANWRAGALSGGSPGAADGQAYLAWAQAQGITDTVGTADDDGDGMTSLVEYALGTNPRVPTGPATLATGVQSIDVNGVVNDYLTMAVTRPVGRDDVTFSADAATNLGTWVSAVLVSSVPNPTDGTETLTFRHPAPKTTDSQQFLRLRLTRIP